MRFNYILPKDILCWQMWEGFNVLCWTNTYSQYSTKHHIQCYDVVCSK